MKKKIPIKDLLLWRLAKAEAEAPPAPAAARLLALARPWWEASPERFQLAIRRLNSIQIPPARLVSNSHQSPSRRPLPALIVRTAEELETSALILRWGLNHRRLQLSFQCASAPDPDERNFEVTFVSEVASKPLFQAFAAKTLSGEYCLEAELSSEVADAWKQLEVTAPLPFRLLLGPVASGV